MKTSLRLTVAGLLSSVLCFLAGCQILPQPQADTVRYFTLDGSAGVASVANAAQVRPVQLAGHLHGRVMAVRVADHEVIYLEDVHWTEPLDAALTRIIRHRLAAVGGGATVTVEVQRFELVRSEGNSVQLAATYTLVSPEGGKAAAQRGVFSSSPRTWDGKDPGVLVGLLRDAAGELADALATTVVGSVATTPRRPQSE